MKTFQVNTIILDSSSVTFPSAISLSSKPESQITTTNQTRNVTAVTPSKTTRSLITDASSVSSSSITSRPPITEIPSTSRSQTSPNNTPLVHIPNPESVDRYVNYKQPTAIKTVRLQPQLILVHIPDTEYTQLLPLQLPSEISTTSSNVYPPLKPLRKPSSSLSRLLDNTSDYKPSQESTSSLFVPHHRYNLRNLPSHRLSTDTSTLNFSALSSYSTLRLARQHAQPLSSETLPSEFDPQSYFTSGLDTASLLSSDAQPAFLSGSFFSEVLIPTPVTAHIRIPEYYTAEHSRPPTPIFADYPIRVDGTTIYDPSHDPRFPIITERFIANNDLLSPKRRETELKRLQNPNLELKFEVKVKFQGFNAHPVFHIAKIKHKTTPALLKSYT